MAAANQNEFPLPAYRFEVDVGGEKLSFQEVSGLEAQMDIEEVPAGGENSFVYRLPKQVRYNNIVLKRGYLKNSKSSTTFQWFKKTLFIDTNLDKKLELKDIKVSLLDEKGGTIVTWSFKKSYPVKFSVGPLNSQENALAIETLEFAYHGFKIE